MEHQAGWYPDPYGQAEQRWWDGTDWTAQTQSLGVVEPIPVASTTDVVVQARNDSVIGHAGTEPVMVQIGEIACTQNWLMVPGSTVPLSGCDFQLRESVTVQRRIPPYAIVLAIIFFMACLLGLLFLLIQEDVLSGSVEVTVSKPGGPKFNASVPVRSQRDIDEVRSKVDYARALVVQAG